MIKRVCNLDVYLNLFAVHLRDDKFIKRFFFPDRKQMALYQDFLVVAILRIIAKYPDTIIRFPDFDLLTSEEDDRILTPTKPIRRVRNIRESTSPLKYVPKGLKPKIIKVTPLQLNEE